MTQLDAHRPARLLVDQPSLRIYQGMAEHWPGREPIDFVFTNPYGAIPLSLHRKPMIIHQWAHRREEAERWCGNELVNIVSKWNDDREVFWSANVENRPLDLTMYHPVSPGWYPEELVDQILAEYVQPGQTVWDGFMGRGTIAKMALARGIHYVGVEMLPQHIAIACRYLEVHS